ncbi:MAG: hypothetical protein EBR30_10640 [Cytophagia bacterium]|nr:hypothetical protein [Cytophagia bacterium]
MADLVGAINELKRLLQEKSRRKASSLSEAVATRNIETTAKAWEQEWEYKPSSEWVTMLKFVPITFGIGREGAIVLYVKSGRGNPAGYIYPRVPFKLFYQYMSTNARGGSVYWGKGVPALKEYSVAARRVGKKIVVKGSIGAKQVKMRGIAFPTRSTTKTKRSVTMYRQIPKSVRIHL